MAYITVTNTLVNGNTADAGELNTNFTDIINGTSDGSKDLNIAALTCAGNVTFNANTTIGNATSDTVTFTARAASDFLPSADDTYDLGSSSLQWKQSYSSDFVASLGADATPSFTFNGDTNTGMFSSGADTLDFSTGGSTRMTINSSGNAGIGTTPSSTYKFAVENSSGPVGYFWRTGGSANASLYVASDADTSDQNFIAFTYNSSTLGGGTACGGIERSGTSQGPTFFSGSDRRIKKDITNREPILSKLLNVEIKDYNYRSGGKGIGPIAQDLIKIFPDKVSATDDGLGEELPDGLDPWTITHNWEWELIQAIQELSAKNDEQQSLIESQQKQVDSLISRIEALEAK